MATLVKKSRGGDKEAKSDLVLMEKLLAHLSEGQPARKKTGLSEQEMMRLPLLQLLTAKPVLYVCNVAEGDASTGNAYCKLVADKAAVEGAACVVVSAVIESEIAQLDEADKTEFLSELGLEEAGLARLIRAGYSLLDLLNLLYRWSKKKPVHGPSRPVLVHHRPPALYIPIFSVVSFGQKLSPLTIILAAKAKVVLKRQENYVSKAATIKWLMAMCFISVLMSEGYIA